MIVTVGQEDAARGSYRSYIYVYGIQEVMIIWERELLKKIVVRTNFECHLELVDKKNVWKMRAAQNLVTSYATNLLF